MSMKNSSDTETDWIDPVGQVAGAFEWGTKILSSENAGTCLTS
jgi:hypothetical protein